MLDEDYWYGAGWAQLRGQLVKLGIRESCVLLAAISSPECDTANAARKFAHGIIEAVANRVTAGIPSMWDYAPPLLGDVDSMVGRILSDTVALSGTKIDQDGQIIDPRRALGQLLRQFFDNAVANCRTGTKYEQDAWRRIDAVSRELAREKTLLEPGARCTDDHIRDVLIRLGEQFPNDHNLPRTFKTLESYFGRFCRDCEFLTIREVRWLIDDTDLTPDIESCTMALEQENRDLLEALAAKLRTPLQGITYVSAQAYRKKKGIGQNEFDRRVNQGREFLRICLERKLEDSTNILATEDAANVVSFGPERNRKKWDD